MYKKLLIVLGMISSFNISLFAFDLNAALQKLSDKEFDINSNYAGIYKLDDTTGKWFLYFPANNYLKIHETGKATNKQGAKTFNPTNEFGSKPQVNNLKVSFTSTQNSDQDLSAIANKDFSMKSNYGGFYHLFDSTNGLWFLWFPVNNYLKIHETGKTTSAEGAITVNISETFEGGISFTGTDPFGDPVGSKIKFGTLKTQINPDDSDNNGSGTDTSALQSALSGNEIYVSDSNGIYLGKFNSNGTYEEYTKDDGQASETMTGTWQVIDTYAVELNIDGTSDVVKLEFSSTNIVDVYINGSHDGTTTITEFGTIGTTTGSSNNTGDDTVDQSMTPPNPNDDGSLDNSSIPFPPQIPGVQ